MSYGFFDLSFFPLKSGNSENRRQGVGERNRGFNRRYPHWGGRNCRPDWKQGHGAISLMDRDSNPAVLTFQAFWSFTKIPGNPFVARWTGLQYHMFYLSEMPRLAFPTNGDLHQKDAPDCIHQYELSKDSPESFLNPEKIKLLSRMDSFNLLY